MSGFINKDEGLRRGGDASPVNVVTFDRGRHYKVSRGNYFISWEDRTRWF